MRCEKHSTSTSTQHQHPTPNTHNNSCSICSLGGCGIVVALAIALASSPGPKSVAFKQSETNKVFIMCLRSTPASPAGDQFRLIGNTLYILHVICVVLYGVAILQFTRATSGTHRRHQPWLTFDSEWLHYGFCMPHEEVPLLSTHERSGCKCHDHMYMYMYMLY